MVDVIYDLGHGGNDSGAIGNGMKEKDIVLDVGKHIKKAAERCKLTYAFTRETDKTMSLSDRSNFANKKGAKCLVSIHVNSAANKDGKGIETFAYKETTKNLATMVQEELLKTGAYTKNRGVKIANHHMTRESNMRACLTELAFISNSEDANLLRTKKEVWAEAIVKAVCRYVGKNYIPPTVTTPPASTDKQLYRICATAVTGVTKADEEINKLKGLGYKDAYKVAVNE